VRAQHSVIRRYDPGVRAAERLRVLTTVMRSFAEATTDLDHLLTVIARSAAEVLGDACVVLVLSDDRLRLSPIAAHAVDADALARARALLETEPFLLASHPAARSVIETHEALLVPRVDPATLQGRTTSAYVDYKREQGIHSLLAVALHTHGEPLGLLTLTRYRPTSPPFDEDDRELALNLAEHASLAISNARLYEAERAARLAAREAAESASRELEAFSYSVAHDLRTPLRGMNGFARILLEDHGEALDEKGRALLEKIASNASKMGHLIDGLLGLARLNRAPLAREDVDLGGMVRAAVAEAARPETEVVVSDALVVNADPTLLSAVVDNLVANAVKFTARVERPRIELGREEIDGEDVYYVRDNGAGFDMQFANLLFKPFQRLHNVRDFEGNGIGLATVERIVTRHGGRIWARGEVGAGATFYFTLPRPERA
jgi:signal transduction histidine kinase